MSTPGSSENATRPSPMIPAGHGYPPMSPRSTTSSSSMANNPASPSVQQFPQINHNRAPPHFHHHVPLSPSYGGVVPGSTAVHVLLPGAGARSRSRSLCNQPLGWSPKRLAPLSPTALSGGKVVLPGLPDIRLHAAPSFPPGSSSSCGGSLIGGGGGGGMDSMLFSDEPPIISESQRSMNAAVQKERERAKAMEKEEANLTADELRTVLKRERHRMARLAADLASVRSMAVQSVVQAEACEEGRINNLMRRLECLQQEKGRIIVELEREEEMLTNNLQKNLDEVRREKAMLEKQQMSRVELEARLAALQKGAGDVDMSEALEEKEEE